MFKRQNIIIFMLIVAVLGLLALAVPFFQENINGIIGSFGGILLFAIIWDHLIAARLSRKDDLVEFVLGYTFAVLILGGALITIAETLRGQIPISTSLILLILVASPIALIVAVLYWGGVLYLLGYPAAAEQHYTNLLHLNENFGYGYVQRATIRYQRGNLNGALDDYQRALDIAHTKASQPNQKTFSVKYSPATIYVNRASIYFQQGDFDTVLSDSESGLAEPHIDAMTEVALRFNRAIALLGKGQHAPALQSLDAISAIQMDERLARALEIALMTNRALALYGLGRVDEARAIWTQLIERDSNYQDIAWLQQQLKWPQPLLDLARGILAN